MAFRAPTFDKIEEIGIFDFHRPPLRENFLGMARGFRMLVSPEWLKPPRE
jgi:hypothetical protein